MIVNYARDREGVERVVREIAGKGGRAVAGQGDVAKRSDVVSKSAVDGLIRVLSKKLGPRKIRVNALNPGGTETEAAHAAGVMGSEFKKQIIAGTPLGRVGQPEDIARVAISCLG